jgi:acyl-CoA synthetase (NDP forming)
VADGNEAEELIFEAEEVLATRPVASAAKGAIMLKACLEYATAQAAESGFARTAQILRLAISSIDEDMKRPQ